MVTQYVLVKVLKHKKKQAENNASRQRKQLKNGVNVRVFPSFWVAAARDYQRHINAIEASYKRFNL